MTSENERDDTAMPNAGENPPEQPDSSESPTVDYGAEPGMQQADTASPSATEQLFGTASFATTPDNNATAAHPHAETKSADSQTKRNPAAFGTILWGVVLMIFAAVMIVTAIPTIIIDTVTLVIVALVAAGVLLVVAGVAAAARRG